MVLNTILLFSIFATFTSCREQNRPKIDSNTLRSTFAIGDTVKLLGDSLWIIFQDKDNNYWFGSNGEGVYRYDGKTIVNFTTKDGLSNDSIRQIQEDDLGNMYFSTMGGISKFDGQKINTLQAIESKEWKLQPNDLWFNMLGKKYEHGPYRYDGKTLYHLEFPKHYLHDEFYEKGINPFFSPYDVYTIYKDRKGFVWFGTSIFGAYRFDGKSLSWMYERDLTIVPSGGSFGIRSIFEDKEGSFWFCNTWHRFIINPNSTKEKSKIDYIKIKGIGNSKDYDGDEYIYFMSILEDTKGDLWMTTYDRGVFKYDGKNITHYSVIDESKDVTLFSMYKDRQGNLWLGTHANGVYKFNGTKFEKFVNN